MPPLKISDAEWDVMQVVWTLKKATAAEVIDELAEAKEWNHRTIRTLLGRLVEKGALTAQTAGNRNVYKAAISRAQCVKLESSSFLEKIFGGDVNSLLAHFIRDPQVSAEDLAELQKLLDKQRKKN